MAPWSIIHDLHSMRLALAKLWKFKYKKVCIPPLEIILSYIDRRWWASFRRRRRRSGVCYPFSGLSLRAKRFVLPWKKRSSKKRYIFSSLYSSIGVFAYHLNVICQNQIFNHVWWNLCDNHEWYILGFDSRFNFFPLPTREKRREEKVYAEINWELSKKKMAMEIATSAPAPITSPEINIILSPAKTKTHKKNMIQVSNTKKPLFFDVNLAKVLLL